MIASNAVLDIEVINAGSVFMVTPRTSAGSDWMTANLDGESWQWIGGSLAVDHRFIIGLIDAVVEDGLLIGATD